jgi:uncharacterized protein (UPF0276 family)
MISQPFIGIGLRQPHYKNILEEKPSIDWLEVHSENYMMKGGRALNLLSSIRKDYPMGLHGIGLSLGSAQGVAKQHLVRLKKLINHIDPFLVSEHLSWSYINNTYIPDLISLPYAEESLQIFCDNIDKTQTYLQRQILIENPSSYIEYVNSIYSEPEFLVNVAQKSGAAILLDVNNIYVSCTNHGWCAKSYIQAIPSDLVKEIHIAGHSIKRINNHNLLIDTHDQFVCQEVWDLYSLAIKRFGKVPTLLEWDAHIPELSVLVAEAQKAKALSFTSVKEPEYA